MNGIAVTLSLILLLSVVEIWRARRHNHYLRQIPIRVHVNGTRGKSSVTRLIAAGMRAGGIKTVGKTTGTKPRFIYDDGSEVPVIRAGKPNIIEQVRIVRRAVQLGAQALVTECMAVTPELQSVVEDRMIQSTHSVITNARADHLDEMGPTVADVAQNLARTISRNGKFFTAEQDHLDILSEAAAIRGSEITVSQADTVDEKTLKSFSYFEHAENVALALAVCSSFGIDRETALAGMYATQPDPGALRIYSLEVFGKRITFVNAFAINDPDSYKIVWERLAPWIPQGAKTIVILNCREDRIQRAEQLGELIAKELVADFYILAGQGTAPVLNKARHLGLAPHRISDLGNKEAAQIFDRVLEQADGVPVAVYGIGNIVGLGEEIVNYFCSRGTEIVY